MTDPELTPETLTTTVSVEISAESRNLVALSPAELRIRSVYNHLTTFGVACLGMFVPLLAMPVVPSPCIRPFPSVFNCCRYYGFTGCHFPRIRVLWESSGRKEPISACHTVLERRQRWNASQHSPHSFLLWERICCKYSLIVCYNWPWRWARCDTGTLPCTSGRKSSYYFAMGGYSAWIRRGRTCGRALLPLVRDAGAEAIGGPTLGANPIVAAVSLVSHLEQDAQSGGVPAFIVRKEAKSTWY